MDLAPENQLAVDLYGKIQALGADLVFRLYDLTLSAVEAENLLSRLELIASTVAEITEQMNKSKQNTQ